MSAVHGFGAELEAVVSAPSPQKDEGWGKGHPLYRPYRQSGTVYVLGRCGKSMVHGSPGIYAVNHNWRQSREDIEPDGY